MYLNGARRPIAFVSRTLNGHETCYGQIDKEALAIMFETVPRVPRFHGSTVPRFHGSTVPRFHVCIVYIVDISRF